MKLKLVTQTPIFKIKYSSTVQFKGLPIGCVSRDGSRNMLKVCFLN